MSWLFSQALVAAYSEAICSDGEQYVPSSGHHTQQAYLSPDKMTDFSRLSRFGMTFKPLTEDLGKAVLTWCQEASRARISQQPGGGQELTAQEVACGNTWQGSWVKYDHDTSLWRTHQCSLLGGLTEFLETWPQWGSMRSGACWEQTMSVPITDANESGLWVTPTTMDSLPPKSQEALMREATITRPGRSRPSNLRDQVSNGHMWPTPQASDHRDRGNLSNPSIKRRIEIGKQVNLSMCVSETSGQLNPMWVEWLMGWPLGWTDLKPLETDKFRQWQQQHGVQ